MSTNEKPKLLVNKIAFFALHIYGIKKTRNEAHWRGDWEPRFVYFGYHGIRRTDMTQNTDRIEPSDLQPEELEKIMGVLQSQVDRPRLVGGDVAIELPEPIFEILVDILTMMRHGKTILLVPQDEEVTTQHAADILGVSRPHVVKLIKEGKIPFRPVGSHRRILLKDLEAFRDQRDAERRKVLDGLFNSIQDEGAYE